MVVLSSAMAVLSGMYGDIAVALDNSQAMRARVRVRIRIRVRVRVRVRVSRSSDLHIFARAPKCSKLVAIQALIDRVTAVVRFRVGVGTRDSERHM